MARMKSGAFVAFAALALIFGASALFDATYGMGGKAEVPEQAPAQKVKSQDSQMKTATVKIKGMYCAGCAVSIRKELEKLLATGELNYANEKAVIHYNPAKASLVDIQAAINKIGYTCELPQDS